MSNIVKWSSLALCVDLQNIRTVPARTMKYPSLSWGMQPQGEPAQSFRSHSAEIHPINVEVS